MVTLKVERQCGCFKRSDFEIEQNFESLEKAKEEAKNMCSRMNEEFCLKHEFETIAVSENELVIKMYLREER